MFIADLTRFPLGHPPSPYDHSLPVQKDGQWGSGQLGADIALCAVGWLGNTIKSQGETPPDCIDKLYEAYTHGRVFADGTKGWHDCELCSGDDQWYPGGQVGPVIHWRGSEMRLFGHGHHLLRLQDIVYMCPALILHYILEHSYLPPDEFLAAVRAGQFLSPTDLLWERD